MRVEVINEKSQFVIEFKSQVDTSFYFDYKVFSKSCYQDENAVDKNNDIDTFHKKLKYSQFLIETDEGFFPYSVYQNCKIYNLEIDDCIFDWLRQINLTTATHFIDTIDLKCINELDGFKDDKIRFHYFFKPGRSQDNVTHDGILISSDWQTLY